MASLQSPLSSPPSHAAELLIASQFWCKQIPPQEQNAYRTYFRYYATECNRLRLGLSKDSWQSTMVATTHEQNLFIVSLLLQSKHSKRPHIRSLIRERWLNADDKAINRSIDFALRTWLTINIRENAFSLHTPRTPTVQWNDETTLVGFVERCFLSAETTRDLRFEDTFTAANIRRLSGIEVEWTPCLADHLRFDARRRLLRVYPFKQVLVDNLKLWGEKDDSEKETASLIPLTVLQDALLSLNLLFRHWDPLTDNFMLEHDQTFHLETLTQPSRTPSLSDFHHFRDRLYELHCAFHSPPVGWTQIWADRRNPQQWYTFWLAFIIFVLTVVFGVISSAAAIVQTSLAFESVRLARLQLDTGNSGPG